jgi:hypothetical protein
MNENMPLKYKQMHLDHDLSASVNRKEDRQYNGLKKTSAKHYTEN